MGDARCPPTFTHIVFLCACALRSLRSGLWLSESFSLALRSRTAQPASAMPQPAAPAQRTAFLTRERVRGGARTKIDIRNSMFDRCSMMMTTDGQTIKTDICHGSEPLAVWHGTPSPITVSVVTAGVDRPVIQFFLCSHCVSIMQFHFSCIADCRSSPIVHVGLI